MATRIVQEWNRAGMSGTGYTYTTQAQVRRAFWQGWPEHFKRGKAHNDYNATIRSEFSAFVDMLQKDGHIPERLAEQVTLG